MRRNLRVLVVLALLLLTLAPSDAFFGREWRRKGRAATPAPVPKTTPAPNKTATAAPKPAATATTTVKKPAPPPEWHKWFTLAIIIVLFFLMAFNYWTTETVAFMALVILWDAGILTAADAVSGFSNSGMLTVGVLFVVVHGVDKSRLAPYLARKIFGIETGERWALFRMCMFAFCLSAFLNNTPIVVMLTPIVRDWARTRGFHPSTFLIPLSYATAAGGMITLIGTSTNLVITGLVTQAGLVNVGFFDIALVALPAGLLSVAAMVWLAPIILPKNDGLFRAIKATGSDLVTEVRVLQNFPYVGKAAGYAMASMGFNAEILIKIRRLNVTVSMTDGEFSSSQGLAYSDIFPVDPSQVILVGDVLFFSGSKAKMMDVLKGANKGLEILGFDSSKLEGTDLQFVEVLLSDRNPFVGDVVMHTSFSAHYGVSVLALRRKGRTASEAWRPGMSVGGGPVTVYPVSPMASCAVARGRPIPPPPFAYHRPRETQFEPGVPPSFAYHRPRESQSEPGAVPVYLDVNQLRDQSCSPPPLDTVLFSHRYSAEPEEAREVSDVEIEVGRSRLGVGDAMLLLARTEFIDKYETHHDFLLVQTIDKKLPPVRMWDYFPLLVFVAMVVIVAVPETNVDMLVAAMSAAAFLILGGWIDAKDAVGLVEWDLLLLIGSMLSLSKAMTNSGLADAIAGLVSGSGISPLGVLFVLYIVTCILTEVLSNNGCAGLCFPIAISIARALQVSYMPFVIIVMFGSTTSFLTPIGYQCNTLVWTPGGYAFTDFTKMGIPLNIIYTLVLCLLSPVIWPFDDARFIITKQ